MNHKDTQDDNPFTLPGEDSPPLTVAGFSSDSEKKCPRCERVKAIEEFSMDRSKKDGRRSHCKACRKIDMANYYSDPTNKPRLLENAKVRRAVLVGRAEQEKDDNDFVATVTGTRPREWNIGNILNDNE